MFRTGQCLEDLEKIKNYTIDHNINDICAVCLQQHENHRTSSMQDKLRAQDKIPVYKILESISLFKYSVKTPQLLCSTCTFKLLNIYEFQQMCNKSSYYFNNYINQEDMQDTYELEIGDAADVEANIDSKPFIAEVRDNSFLQERMDNKQKSYLRDLIGAIFESSTFDNDIPTIEDLNTDDDCKLEIADIQIHDLDSGSEGNIESIQKRIDHEAGATFELTEHGAHPKGQHSSDKKASCTDARRGRITEFPCKYCNKVFGRKQVLSDHENLHTGEKPYNQCTRAFASFNSLYVHKVTHNPERLFCCNHCGKTFKGRGGLTQHLISHTNSRSHVCSLCNKSFNRKSALGQHIRRHNYRPKSFKCDQCPKAYVTSTGLKSHKLDHTAERPFVCDICPKTFKRRGNFNEHMRYHVNARSHVCSMCGKGFNAKNNLMVHIKRMHNNGDNDKSKISATKS